MHQLTWLPTHADFRSALRAVRNEAEVEQRLTAAQRLCGFQRDFLATDQLARLIDDCARELGGLECARSLPLTAARLALLGTHSLAHLQPAIRVAGLSRRLAISIHLGAYGQYRQSLLGDDRELAEFAPRFVLLALDAHDAPFHLPLAASESEVEAAITRRVDELRELWRRARERYAAQVIQQTLLPAAPQLFGSFEALVPASPWAMTEQLNGALRKAARQEGVLLLDLAFHAARGSDVLGDPVRWHQAKQLVSPIMAPLYGDLVARVLAASLGLSRKALVLDLDNTLWGGVIGDDGLDGIQLGQGSAAGEAHLALQRYAAALNERGIVLAVCSKNELEIAEHAFEHHPEMALKRSDIACFMANWSDKATNLRNIARTLNLGLDALVFVDDNPAEREIVRRELPEVAVPELPEDVAHYPAVLSAAGYFESASFTADDAARSGNYAANVERQALLERATDLPGYLRSLEMVLQAGSIGPVELPRAAQLINKSNQFNLVTRRYTETELAQRTAEPGHICLWLRLRDKFGDNGVISVMLARPDAALAPDAWLIDTWLMSCRVLGRQVEQAALEVLAGRVHAAGARVLIGEYRPTAKNALVRDHYAKLGFLPMQPPAASEPHATFWRYDLHHTPTTQHCIRIEERP